MKYSTEPRKIKDAKGCGFLSARKFGNGYNEKLMDAAAKTGINNAKSASKRVGQKTAETTGYLIGNKIANKMADEMANNMANKII